MNCLRLVHHSAKIRAIEWLEKKFCDSGAQWRANPNEIVEPFNHALAPVNALQTNIRCAAQAQTYAELAQHGAHHE